LGAEGNRAVHAGVRGVPDPAGTGKPGRRRSTAAAMVVVITGDVLLGLTLRVTRGLEKTALALGVLMVE